MNVSNDLKCEVCGKITRIKVQMGWLEKYPINIKCNECHISIFGEFNLKSNSNESFVNLKNVTLVDGKENPDFILEVSGELLTEKIRDYTGGIDTLFSPFIKTMMMFNSNGKDETEFMKYKSNVIKFLNATKNEWSTVKRVNELWLEQNYKYLPSELHKKLDDTKYPADNELEYLRGVHALNIFFLNPIFGNYFFKTSDFIFKRINELIKKDKEQFKNIAISFEHKLNVYEEKVYTIMCNFVEKFEMFIPILGLDYLPSLELKEFQLKKLGLTTVDFENIKGYYIDTFEDVVGLFDLVLAYENLFERNDFTQMDTSVNNQIKTLQDFQKMAKKGKKIEFIDSLKAFDKIFTLKIDNRIRNAIGHRSYTYDVKKQSINYYPSGDINKGEQEEIYLVEFVYNCFKLFETCMGVGELIYQTRKFLYVFNGVKVRSQYDYYPELREKINRSKANSNSVNENYSKNKKNEREKFLKTKKKNKAARKSRRNSRRK